jgi:DNA-binding transcriptional LysR family regulator
MLGLDNLLALEAIVDHGTFRAAAKALFKAQSAVSYSIRMLEEQYQVQLFDRSEYRPKLTKEGELFYKRAKELLDEARGFEGFAKNMTGTVETEFRISLSALYPLKKITPILHELKEEFPTTDLHIMIEILSGETLLRNKEVDCALTEDVNREGDWEIVNIENIDMPLVVSKQHEEECKKLTDFQKRYPQIVVKSTIPNVKQSVGVKRDAKKWFVSDMNSKKRLILDGLGWGRLPLHYVEKEIKSGKLIRIDTKKKDQLQAPLSLVRRNTDIHGPLANYFWDKVQEI